MTGTPDCDSAPSMINSSITPLFALRLRDDGSVRSAARPERQRGGAAEGGIEGLTCFPNATPPFLSAASNPADDVTHDLAVFLSVCRTRSVDWNAPRRVHQG